MFSVTFLLLSFNLLNKGNRGNRGNRCILCIYTVFLGRLIWAFTWGLP